jgi:hypothetical protein
MPDAVGDAIRIFAPVFRYSHQKFQVVILSQNQ